MLPFWSLVLLQTVATLPVPADFDLATVRPTAARCGDGSGDTIVVCAPKAMDIVVKDAAAFGPEEVRAETGLPGGGTLGVTAAQRRDAPPAIMVGFKLPF